MEDTANQVVRSSRREEVEKTLYEVRYELANRPEWVTIPLAGILVLPDQAQRPAEAQPWSVNWSICEREAE